MSLGQIQQRKSRSRFAFLGAFLVSCAIGFSSAVIAAGPGPVYSISADLLYRSPEGYQVVVKKMRAELGGRVPKKFMVDGVEYTGNYYRSGSFADVYKVVENGKTIALRIPRSTAAVNVENNHAQVMQDLNARGIPSAKVISVRNTQSLATKVEFLEGFQSVNDVLDKGSQYPNDPRVQKQLTALKEYAQKYGKLNIGDLHGDNIGFVPTENGKFTVKIVDAMEFSDNFTTSRVSSGSPLGEIFEVIEEFYAKSDELQIPKGVTDAEYRARLLKNLAEMKTGVMGEAYPASFGKGKVGPWVAPKVKVTAATKNSLSLASEANEARICQIQNESQMKSGLRRTMGGAGDLMSVSGIILAAVAPETNPYAGEPIGVPCEVANRLKDRAKCEWDTPLNPFDHGANCSVIREVVPIGKTSYMLRTLSDEKVCRIVYDSFGFNVDDEASREKLKNAGLFTKDGAKLTYKTTAGFFDDLKKKVKLADSFLRVNVKFPEPTIHDQEII